MKQKWTSQRHFERRGHHLYLSNEIPRSYTELLYREAKFSHRMVIEHPFDDGFATHLGEAVSYFERPNGETFEVYHSVWERNGFLPVSDIRRKTK